MKVAGKDSLGMQRTGRSPPYRFKPEPVDSFSCSDPDLPLKGNELQQGLPMTVKEESLCINPDEHFSKSLIRLPEGLVLVLGHELA